MTEEKNEVIDNGGKLDGLRVCIVVENLPVPFDRRVWQEAGTLRDAGAIVSIISPKAKQYTTSYELFEGIHIYRHPLPAEADTAFGYFVEYSVALFWQTYLAFKIKFTRGIDVIHGCNPPDLIFLVALLMKPFGVKYVFDHHDINPELFEAKFSKTGIFYKLICIMERLTFKTANISIATNNSYKEIAVMRGGMDADNVHVVRSGPKLDRLVIKPAVEKYKNGRQYLVGYVGVMGKQEGIDAFLESISFIVNQMNRKDIQFALIGSGTEFDNLVQLSKKMKLEDYVNFTGRVSDDELVDILNTAEVCVNPDVVNPMNDKSTMNKIMEYMALAKPIVQYEMVEGRFSAQTASLYAEANNIEDFASKIVELIDSPEMRSRMGEFGRDRVMNELNWEHEAPKLISAYRSITRTER